MNRIKLKNLVSFVILLISVVSGHLFAQDNEEVVWPKEIISGKYTILLYEPENTSYLDNKVESALAFSVKEGDGTPDFGMMWTTSLLDVDRDSRQASLVSVKIDEIRLGEKVAEENKAKLEKLINAEIPKWEISFPIDDFIEDLEAVSVTTAELNNTPPKILFAKEPTALILVDGEPKMKEAEKGLEMVENTGAFIVKESNSNNLYLKGGEFWYVSTDAKGPWKLTKKVPSKIKKAAKKAENESNDENEEEDAYKGEAPKILVAFEPSELIVFEGEPDYSPIQNTNLLYAKNTESDIFLNVKSQTYFVLISGRWFTTKELKGPWENVASEDLPEDFGNIPSDSGKSNVLSSVAGTKEAKMAVYDAQIPQTAAVKKDTKANTVIYNGNPEFKKIEGLKLEYAVNTESAVFKDKKTYYLCDNAIWFSSNTPNGPWKVSEERPKEVEKIPPTNPKYNTKYVYIYETSPTVVYVGYTPGYYGTYVYGPTVVYGTGIYYNPWYGGHYYHHHYTYGFSVRYNPWYGWSVGFHYGSPYGWYGHAYWGVSYHHWGPRYYRPPYYRRGYYPRPSHPIYTGRRGVSNYTRPRASTRPSTGARRPSQTRPSTRPSRPNVSPSRPSTKPATRPSVPKTKPATRPSGPSTRPATKPTVPRTRPSNPTTRPSTGINRSNYNRSNMPNTRPTTRPSTPSYRSSPRPTSRPVARPSRGGGRRR